MDDQKNFITAMVLSGVVLLGYWFFFGKPLAEQARKDALAERAQAERVLATPQAPKIEIQDREKLITTGTRIPIDTPTLQGSFQVTGSRFDDLRLKNHRAKLAKDSGPVTLLTPEGANHAAYIFDNWLTPDGGSGVGTTWQHISGDILSVDSPVILQFDSTNYSVTRSISIDDRYLITLDDTVTNTSSGEISLQRKGASRQHDLPDDLTNFFILQEGPVAIIDNKLVDMKYGKLAKKKSVIEIGESGWVGLTDKYWLTAAIAPQGKQMTSRFNFRQLNDQDIYEAEYSLDPVTLTPGTTIRSKGFVFAGAKDRHLLENYRNTENIARFDLAIDWGFLGILTRPMSTFLTFLGSKIGNYGLAIMALTLLIKILMFPLFNKQYESQAKMKKVAPKLKKIQTRYKDDRLKLQQEMMALYKKEGVNPAAGCLPMIPFMFVFFALYKTVLINVNLRHAPFFGWIKDLSARDPLSILNGFGILPWDAIPFGALSFLAIGPLAILYGISMALIYTLTPQTAGGGEQAEMMAKMMKFMPWIFMFVLAPFATGLLVYWVWNNILSFAQQYYITRKFKVDTPVDVFWRKITGKAKPEDA